MDNHQRSSTGEHRPFDHSILEGPLQHAAEDYTPSTPSLDPHGWSDEFMSSVEVHDQYFTPTTNELQGVSNEYLAVTAAELAQISPWFVTNFPALCPEKADSFVQDETMYSSLVPYDSYPVAPLRYVPPSGEEYDTLTSGLVLPISHTQTHKDQTIGVHQSGHSWNGTPVARTDKLQYMAHDQAEDSVRHAVQFQYPLIPSKMRSRYSIPTGPAAASVPKPTLSAADLIGQSRNNPTRQFARPRGVQRMLTYNFVVQKARRHGVSVPHITETDVRLYCHTGNSAHHPVRSTFPPPSIDLRLMDGIEITTEELLTFFPDHIKWHDFMFRLAQNGWQPVDMAKYINYSRGLAGPHDVNRNITSQWLRAADKVILGRQPGDAVERRPWKTTCFTTQGWTPHQGRVDVDPLDYFLIDLADGVSNLPQGDGARLLTRAVRHAIAHGHDQVKLGQLKQYVRTNMLIFPLLPSMTLQMAQGQHPDTVAVQRFRSMLRDAAEAACTQAGH
jgi:hypothetical protein